MPQNYIIEKLSPIEEYQNIEVYVNGEVVCASTLILNKFIEYLLKYSLEYNIKNIILRGPKEYTSYFQENISSQAKSKYSINDLVITLLER